MLTFDQIDQAARFYRDHPSELNEAVRVTPKTRTYLLDRLGRDPLLHRYVRHLKNRATARNTQPWHAMGERLYAALLLCHAGTQPSIRMGASFGDQADEPMAVGLASGLLLMAVPYLWSEQVEDLVRASPSIPPHTVSRDLLPYPVMFFSYEVAYHAVVAGRNVDIDWCVLSHRAEGVEMLVQAACPDDRTVTFEAMSIPYGKRWPDDFPAPVIDPVAGAGIPRELFTSGANAGIELILKRLAFINSPYTTTERHRLPREIRRELAREKDRPKPEHEPFCNVVVLRRALPTAAPGRVEGDAQPRDWRGHWWVSGHYRAQWLPSTKSHKVIWVAPYVKGPLDKPLIEKTYAVIR